MEKMATENLKTPATVQKRKLLIVEDEGEMCFLINLLLAGREFEIEHVKSIAAAVEYLQQEQPAVVLLDNRLPDGYGLDFISFLKEKYPSTKIIMITGADAEAKDVAIENGADLFLEKPFNKQQLWQSVHGLLN
ncbi:response regulator [Foetidibacter luteolus]|uniref:response regulator n=1 Tax=Foetidibacter luteolus TaxID=2608880 RepID=UPI00129A6E8D|nr:response regulator [Foetidibacter luteolus]